MTFETAEIPFMIHGNRLLLTDQQLAEMPWLLDFIKAFPKCFERSPAAQIWYYYPDGDAPPLR